MATLNRYLRCTKASLAFVSETRCGIATAEKRIKGLPLCNAIVVPSKGQSGGLWVLWGQEVDVNLISKNRSVVVVEVVQKVLGYAWLFIGVYGDPHRTGNQSIWEEIDSFLEGYDGPACVAGDFNAIVSMQEKWGGSSQMSSQNIAFRQWIHSAGLVDLGYKGPAYTWSNKKQGGDNISERLDRVLVNIDWALKFPKAAVFHLPRFSSDHLPILLRTDPSVKARHNSYRWENWWMLDESFKAVCESAGDKGHDTWDELTSQLKVDIKKWLRQKETPPKVLIQIENELKEVLESSGGHLEIDRENELQQRHQKCLLMLQHFWQQRSRIEWAVNGDCNTRYFHASAVTRYKRNSICALRDETGNWVTDLRGIRQMFVTHFKSIYVKKASAQVQNLFGPDCLQGLSKIPEEMADYLQSIPTDTEIHGALMSLGPDKAPGPDGLNARAIQGNWATFGPTFLKEVRVFFQTAVMRPSIAMTKLVLIPKIDEPTKVTQYRPISICNVIYKTISKIIAQRLKPYMGSCVARAQAAFVPGRNISDNVILLREVLHSFGLKNYKNQEFCLKVDLSKAFDRMDWDYLQTMLPLYGVPQRMVAWIMSCVRSAKFSIVLNGSADGFFVPQCGLRQGCALSPYLFIIGMDLLSRTLSNLAQAGNLRGVRIAPRADPLTNSVYADDLLLFGSATKEEAQTIMAVLQAFEMVSGQQIGPEKSTIWFSRSTGRERQEEIAQIIGVSLEAEAAKYLGAPISTARGSFDFLLEKFSSKLNMWKSRVLSQAGRLVVIQSVLQSLPIYYMATSQIPAKVLNQLNNLIRRFYWGALDKTRYLAYTAWEKITMPKQMGGLAIRDLAQVNSALLLKSLWHLAKGEDLQWVKLVKAKYLPNSKLWHSKRTYLCTNFWRALMNLREQLGNMVNWNLGDGSGVCIFGEPWFQNALQYLPQNHTQKSLTVDQLSSEEGWDASQLIQLFGAQTCIQILSNCEPPKIDAGSARLIFKNTVNGEFSVKHAYTALRNDTIDQRGINRDADQIWKIIWRKGTVVPRLRHFLWKLIQNGLPLAKLLHHRISRGDPFCQTCNEEEEDSLHLIFRCPFAKACWFICPLALRTDQFAGMDSIREALKALASITSEEDWVVVTCVIWSIWRCRNDKAYSAKDASITQFKSYLSTIMLEASLRVAGHQQLNPPVLQHQYEEPEPLTRCQVDGSWIANWEGGLGFVIWEGELLIEAKSKGIHVSSPIQAEALAIFEAVKRIRELGITECSFETDCKTLAESVMAPQPPMHVDWRAFREIFQVWRWLKESRGLRCKFIPRERNETADGLAKKGTRQKWDISLFTFPFFPLDAG